MAEQASTTTNATAVKSNAGGKFANNINSFIIGFTLGEFNKVYIEFIKCIRTPETI